MEIALLVNNIYNLIQLIYLMKKKYIFLLMVNMANSMVLNISINQYFKTGKTSIFFEFPFFITTTKYYIAALLGVILLMSFMNIYLKKKINMFLLILICCNFLIYKFTLFLLLISFSPATF